MYNTELGRKAIFSYVGNNVFTFKILDSSGEVIATGEGTESEVESRADDWLNIKS